MEVDIWASDCVIFERGPVYGRNFLGYRTLCLSNQVLERNDFFQFGLAMMAAIFMILVHERISGVKCLIWANWLFINQGKCAVKWPQNWMHEKIHESYWCVYQYLHLTSL